MSQNYSELEVKEDSLEQQQALSGIPSKFTFTASDHNKIREKINNIYAILKIHFPDDVPDVPGADIVPPAKGIITNVILS